MQTEATPPAEEVVTETAATAQELATEAAEELHEIKVAALDSAELATRAASLATNAGTDMRQATELMMATQAKHRKQSLILLISSGSLMLLTACIFIGMSMAMQSRLGMVDAMLLAVGKRVTELDGTMETVASVNESLQAMSAQQEGNKKLQDKIDTRLDEVIKTAQAVPEAAAKEIESKNQVLAKQVQAMDSRLQAQASTLRSISQQVQAIQGQVSDSGQKLRAEVESMSRQQRERQSAEQAASRAATQKQKDKESAVQYPRLPTPGLGPANKP